MALLNAQAGCGKTAQTTTTAAGGRLAAAQPLLLRPLATRTGAAMRLMRRAVYQHHNAQFGWRALTKVASIGQSGGGFNYAGPHLQQQQRPPPPPPPQQQQPPAAALSHVAAALRVLRQSAAYERQSGCGDTPGRDQSFSQFAYGALVGLRRALAGLRGAGLLAWETEARLGLLEGRYSEYPRLPPHERHQLVADLESAVARLERELFAPPQPGPAPPAWQGGASPPPPPPQQRPAQPMFQQQQQQPQHHQHHQPQPLAPTRRARGVSAFATRAASFAAPAPPRPRASAAEVRAALPPVWQLYYPPPRLEGALDPHASEAAAAAAAVQAAAAAAASEVTSGSVTSSEAVSVTATVVESEEEAEAEPETDDDGGAGGGPRPRDAESALWRAFVAAARADADRRALEAGALAGAAGLEQRTDAWLKLREARLTASALPNVVGTFGSRKLELLVRAWEEKVGLAAPQPPNESMMYGTRHEADALGDYERAFPAHAPVAQRGFTVWGADDAHGWVGASPDGLIGGAATADGGWAADGSSVTSDAAGADGSWAAGADHLEGGGVLEIKCPYKASPAKGGELRLNEYYMHQVQTLMAIHGAKWARLYYWSEEVGSAVAHVAADADYWAILYDVMADFWWCHVVPARLALAAAPGAGAAPAVGDNNGGDNGSSSSSGSGDKEQLVNGAAGAAQFDPAAVAAARGRYEPRGLHPYSRALVALSKALLDAAPSRAFTPEETRGAAAWARVLARRAAAAAVVAEADAAAAAAGDSGSFAGSDRDGVLEVSAGQIYAAGAGGHAGGGPVASGSSDGGLGGGSASELADDADSRARASA